MIKALRFLCLGALLLQPTPSQAIPPEGTFPITVGSPSQSGFPVTQTSVRKTFRLCPDEDAAQAGFNNLSDRLYIPGTGKSVLPILSHKASDATSGGWAKAGYGDDLAPFSDVSGHTYNANPATPGSTDQAVILNGLGSYQSTATGVMDVGDNDFVVSLWLRSPPPGTSGGITVFGSEDHPVTGSGDWISVYYSNSTIYMRLTDNAVTTAQTWAVHAGNDEWMHAMYFGNLDDGSGVWFINGIQTGAVVDLTPLGPMNPGVGYNIGSRVGGGVYFEGGVGRVTMWSEPGLLDTHLQGEVAMARFLEGVGYEAALGLDGTLPETYTRTTSATLEKYSGGSWNLFTVSKGWPRIEVGENMTSILLEESRTNLVNYSDDLSTGWTLNVNDTHSFDGLVGPDGTMRADGIIAGAVLSGHQVNQNIGALTIGDVVAYSVIGKSGDQPFLNVQTNASPSNVSVRFATSDCSVAFTSDDGTLEDTFCWRGANGWVRAGIVITAQATGGSILITGFKELAGTSSYTGDGVTVSGWLAGIQVERGANASSYIRTEALDITRAADSVYYKGDGNVGGSGDNRKGYLKAKFQGPEVHGGTPGVAFNVVTIADGSKVPTGADRLSAYIRGDSDRMNTRLHSTEQGSFLDVAGDIGRSSDGGIHVYEYQWSQDRLVGVEDGSFTSLLTAPMTPPNAQDRIYPGATYTGSIQEGVNLGCLEISSGPEGL